MDNLNRVGEMFRTCADAIIDLGGVLAPKIAAGAEVMVAGLLAGGKILACGNGGSAADAQHFAAEMLNRFEIERPGLPAIALSSDGSTLTAIGNDYDFTEIFEKQIRALGQRGDVLLAITTSGKSANIVKAITAAHERDMRVIALTGRDGGAIPQKLLEGDLEIRIPLESTPRIQELQILSIHCLCDLIDRNLLGIGG